MFPLTRRYYARMPLEHGASFAGYTVRRLLGTGGMGDVYLVDHPRLPRSDAMKVLREPSASNEEYRRRFNREAELAATLWHPHIVGLHDRGEFEGLLWITMDFVDGTDAAQLAVERYPHGMPVELVVAIVEAVGSALDHAHERGLLHRDIKPANILISGEGAKRRILLSDFGIARHMADVSGFTGTNHAIGTVAYSAPEQLMGGEIDGRADQYALAATAFRLLTGVSPFQETNPVAVISQHLHAPPPRVSGRRAGLVPLDAVLMKAMSKDRNDRFATCTEFAEEFARQAGAAQVNGEPAQQNPPPRPPHPAGVGPPTMPWVTPQSPLHPPPQPPARPPLVSSQLAFQPPPRRKRGWLAVGAVAVVAAVAVTAVVLATGSDDGAATATGTDGSTTTSATATAWPTPTPIEAPGGGYEDIESYLNANGFAGTYQHRGDEDAPTVVMPIPPGWRDEQGNVKPNFAYQMLVYDGPHAGEYPPFVIVSLSKLPDDVDAADVEALWARASGELYNLDGWVADGPGWVGTLDGHREFEQNGTWVPSGKPQLITHKSVFLQWPRGVYLLQINIYAALGDVDIRDRIVDDLDEVHTGIQIFPP